MSKHDGYTLDKDLPALIAQARRFAADINRNPGGREVALMITRLQEAYFWFDAACRAINEHVKVTTQESA